MKQFEKLVNKNAIKPKNGTHWQFCKESLGPHGFCQKFELPWIFNRVHL
jgi:hypothetical protein